MAPKLLPKQDRPRTRPLWRFLAFAYTQLCVWALVNACTSEGDQLVATKMPTDLQLFLEDIRNAQPVDPPVVIPQEPVKLLLPKPKPEPVVKPEPETVRYGKTPGRAKRRQE